MLNLILQELLGELTSAFLLCDPIFFPPSATDLQNTSWLKDPRSVQRTLVVRIKSTQL